jgi:hypothetical protein
MNEHEIQRIAAAMHELRPDWPAASIRTVIAKNLADKPRRDVCVALAWVACETNSATPARVMESGPWWRAAAVDGATTNGPEKFDPLDTCSICGKRRQRCAAVQFSGHSFVSAVEGARQAAETSRADLAREAMRAGKHTETEEAS